MHRITIVPRTPYHTPPDDLADLVRRIEALDDTYQVVVPPEEERDPRRRMVSWWEGLEVHLPWILAGGGVVVLAAAKTLVGKVVEKTVEKTAEALAEKAAEQITKTVGEWIRERRAKPESHKNQPAALTIYGSDGRVLKRVEYHGPEYEPVEEKTDS